MSIESIKNENFFDSGPNEPELCKLIGFSDCERCYYRRSTLKRITQDVRKLRGRLPDVN
jgi:hypothetical protein